ncbi:helix-turn-helix transcriptional regulator [Pantoea stewartii]|uniref:helix-turn-helix transcriptional regulator n=1 Tax=Pantoea stewartii TaxID=66269 RepID=UPI00126A6E1D|nr:hypothetical protein [Pantoea stewartii]MBC0853631.1 hypothetical protein [Pantoea stewartii]
MPALPPNTAITVALKKALRGRIKMELKSKQGKKVYLTEQELSLSWLFMTGMTVNQIAYQMASPVHVIYYLKQKIMQKVGVRNNSEFILWLIHLRK